MMPYQGDDPGEQLLEYETEQPEDQERGIIEPVPVCLGDPVVTVATVAQHVTCRTIVLTSGEPYTQLLPLDPLRTRAQIMLKGANDIVLCHSLNQAQNPANLDATLARPDGLLISSGLTTPVVLENTGPMWVVAAAYPTRVGLIVERRTT